MRSPIATSLFLLAAAATAVAQTRAPKQAPWQGYNQGLKCEASLDEAQKRLDAKVEEVRKRTDLDERRKEMEIANQQQVESKRLDVAKKEIEDRKRGAIEKSRGTMKQSVSSIKKNIRMLAAFLAPIPAAIMGLYMFMRKMAAQGRVS